MISAVGVESVNADIVALATKATVSILYSLIGIFKEMVIKG